MTTARNARAAGVKAPAALETVQRPVARNTVAAPRQDRLPFVVRRRAVIFAASAGLVAVELVRDRLLSLAGGADA